VRDLPRKLTADELAELFGGHTRLVDRLARAKNPLERAEEIALAAPEEEQVEALATHPRIGEQSAEQRGGEPGVIAALAELNRAYEATFGFRFVVFVNRRSRSELLPVLRERLADTREDELETGIRELVAIARDRWQRGGRVERQ
jgi:2-oxo-4-hydroxy-4-carboxy--5-ureidoimidazoline (OHCU) decarboxylase